MRIKKLTENLSARGNNCKRKKRSYRTKVDDLSTLSPEQIAKLPPLYQKPKMETPELDSVFGVNTPLEEAIRRLETVKDTSQYQEIKPFKLADTKQVIFNRQFAIENLTSIN